MNETVKNSLTRISFNFGRGGADSCASVKSLNYSLLPFFTDKSRDVIFCVSHRFVCQTNVGNQARVTDACSLQDHLKGEFERRDKSCLYGELKGRDKACLVSTFILFLHENQSLLYYQLGLGVCNTPLQYRQLKKSKNKFQASVFPIQLSPSTEVCLI